MSPGEWMRRIQNSLHEKANVSNCMSFQLKHREFQTEEICMRIWYRIESQTLRDLWDHISSLIILSIESNAIEHDGRESHYLHVCFCKSTDFYNVSQEAINHLNLALMFEARTIICYVAFKPNQMNKVTYGKREGHTRTHEDTDI